MVEVRAQPPLSQRPLTSITESDAAGCSVAVWVVAIEYAGADLQPLHPAARRPVLEHAYDLDTGRLAHDRNTGSNTGDDVDTGGSPLRVGFPRPTRGWPAPAALTRCAGCSLAVTNLITGMVADIVGRTATDLTRWAIRFTELAVDDMLLWPPPPDPLNPLDS